MDLRKVTGVVAGAAVFFGFGAPAPAAAADGHVFGLQQTVADAGGGEIGYTLTKFLPSGDAIPFPVSGRLYEVTVRADALNGMPTPAIPAFSAQSESGQSYPALAGVLTPQTFSGATLLPGGRSTGKVYFDAVGEAPTSVVYNNAGNTLTWIEAPTAPAEEEPAAEEEAPAEEPPAGGEEAPAESEGSDSGAADTEANGDVAAEEEG
ncbi:DUF1942 domain-containing protein [Mycobacterium sp. ITM-2016-00318]|uniref:DUF1942 domain-containing protein n=1 Tax=Mycobacterium sp. ITM-2016-00318 TaxID=2099693 RepID=UPI000CF922C3|nr:DUF1942 domain-containing protein [Mycobacterium sp. ITM-2016-00318]WNG93731.1 DUF1942 domain-containing protein [Mycobacterium sp. ITM-2016-00318]